MEYRNAALRGAYLFMQRYPEVLLAILSALLVSLLLRCTTQRGSRVFVYWRVVGMLPTVVTNSHRLLDHVASMLRELDNTLMFRGQWIRGMEVMLTCSPDSANHMFSLHFSDHPKDDEFHEIFYVFGDGIINADGDSWREQRRMARTHMNTPRFRDSVGDCTLSKSSPNLLPLLKDVADQFDKVVDLSDRSVYLHSTPQALLLSESIQVVLLLSFSYGSVCDS